MKLSFTICSANYLPYAKALGDSLIQNNPDYTFYIVLLDRYSDFDRQFFQPHNIISIEDIQLPEFEDMNSRYSIFELSCALKPFVTEYFLKKESSVEIVCYFDSDILIFNKLSEIENQIKYSSIILTPHISVPFIEDGNFPGEETILRAGIFNGGFFAVKKSVQTFQFLSWWKSRLYNFCYDQVANGLFVDQIWLNYVPLFFTEVHILYNPGYNVAYWNLHQNEMEMIEETFCVNKKYPLVFYHFSGYDINNPQIISKHQNRYSFENKPETILLYKKYTEEVLKNDYLKFASLKSTFGFVKEDQPIIIKPKKFSKEYFKNVFK